MGLYQGLAFIILSLMGAYYVFNPRIYNLKNPFDKQISFSVTNSQYLLLFLLASAILGCGGDLMASRLLTSIILAFLMLLINNKRIEFSRTVFLYFFYLLWLIIATIYSPSQYYGLRVFLKYLYPFLMMLFASQVTTSEVFYLKGIQIILRIALFGALCLLVFYWIPVLGSVVLLLTYYGTAILDFFPVAIAISFLYYSHFKKKKYLFYIFIFFLSSVVHTNRTGILAAFITIIIAALVRYRLKALPYIIGGLVIFGGAVLSIPEFRAKMFKKQMNVDEIVERRDELTVDDINTNGRSAMWEWSLNNFYKNKEWTGSGLGVTQRAFQGNLTPFNMPAVHNDYIQIICDTGLIGLILYGLTLLSLIAHCFIVYFKTYCHPAVKFAAFVAGVSMAGMVSTLYTDNVVNYSLMTLGFPFALYGMMLGLKANTMNTI